MKICIGCARPKGQPHTDWCCVSTGTLSTLPLVPVTLCPFGAPHTQHAYGAGLCPGQVKVRENQEEAA